MKPVALSLISAVIITKNESDGIGKCVKAVQQVADEVIVIDAFSEDNTVDICQSLGAKVIQHPWKGYSANKNFGHAQAKHDWILSVDADEILSTELIKSLQEVQVREGEVYALDRINNFCGQWIRYSGWYPDWKVRLFNKNQVLWQGDYVHETLSIPDNFAVKRLVGKLYHYSYDSLEDHRARIEKYTELAAQEIFDKEKNIGCLKPRVSPFFRFFRTYVLKLGFLDGYNGFLIARGNAFLAKRKYEKLKDLKRQQKNKS